MIKHALLTLVAVLSLAACGTHYPHDPAVCTTDADCAAGNQCLPEWTHPDGGASCLSTSKACKKPCTADTECGYCGAFGVCATDICDEAGAQRTCGSFCGDAK